MRALALLACVAAASAFVTVPLQKKPFSIQDRISMNRSLRVTYDETGAPSGLVINNYMDAQCVRLTPRSPRPRHATPVAPVSAQTHIARH